MKKVVAFFSASGVTARTAKVLADTIGADLYEIKPATPYTRADLDWRDRQSRSTIEMNDPQARPAMANAAPDLTAYDTVFVGFPIWWYTAPSIIKTFLEACTFTGQTIALFATSGGSGLGESAKALAPCCPGATIRGGKLFNGEPNEKALAAWAQTF